MNELKGGSAVFRSVGDRDYASGVYDKTTGLVKFRNCCWFTNIDHGRRHQPLRLMTEAENIRFSKHKEIKGIGYQKYENYDAIEVNYCDAIPSDYDGIMGVPITFLDYYNPDQFEIIWLDGTDISKWYGIGPYLNGKKKYHRIFIRKRVG